MPRNVLLFVIFGPILFGCAVSIVFSMTLQRYVPSDLNTTKWSEFSHKVEDVFQIQNKYYAVPILMAVHTLQMYCCPTTPPGTRRGGPLVGFPMLHITKVFYGYWLGLFFGYFLCVAWESMLYLFYLQYVRKDVQSNVGKKTTGKSHDRDCNSLFIDATTSNQSASLFNVRSLQEGIHDGLYDYNICHDVEECDCGENVDIKSISIPSGAPEGACDFIFPGIPNTFDDLFFVERFFVAEEHGCIARRFRTYQ